MLDERKAAILRAVVEEYIDTAQPVGSAHVVKSSGRARLVGDGAQRHGHPGAGGLPPPTAHQRRAGSPPRRATGSSSTTWARRPPSRDPMPCRCARSSSTAHGEIEQMLQDTSRLARRPHELRRRRGRRSPHRGRRALGAGREPHPHDALVVAVLSNGAVEKHSIDLADGGPTPGRRRRRGAHRRRHRPPGRPPPGAARTSLPALPGHR